MHKDSIRVNILGRGVLQHFLVGNISKVIEGDKRRGLLYPIITRISAIVNKCASLPYDSQIFHISAKILINDL